MRPCLESAGAQDFYEDKEKYLVHPDKLGQLLSPANTAEGRPLCEGATDQKATNVSPDIEDSPKGLHFTDRRADFPGRLLLHAAPSCLFPQLRGSFQVT